MNNQKIVTSSLFTNKTWFSGYKHNNKKPSLNLIYDTQLNHACAWLLSFSHHAGLDFSSKRSTVVFTSQLICLVRTSSTTVLLSRYILSHYSVYVLAKYFTYMFLLLLQDGGLLHCTFYAHDPLKHIRFHNNVLSLSFKLIFIIIF